MPAKLGRFARAVMKLKRAGNFELIRTTLKDHPLSANQLCSLSNMSRERRLFILNGLPKYGSFSAADKASVVAGVNDTLAWGEVTSRLARGSGNVKDAVGSLLSFKTLLTSSVQVNKLCSHASVLKSLSQNLFDLSIGLDSPAEVDSSAIRRHRQEIGQRISRQLAFNQIMGILNACISYIEKSIRDIPDLVQSGLTPTVHEKRLLARKLIDVKRSCALIEILYCLP